jgi:hypothetical protein
MGLDSNPLLALWDVQMASVILCLHFLLILGEGKWSSPVQIKSAPSSTSVLPCGKWCALHTCHKIPWVAHQPTVLPSPGTTQK